MGTQGSLRVIDQAAELTACGAFRDGLYGCLRRRADALFELADTLVAGHAVATGPPPHLSLEPAFRRGWGSTYGALRRGRIDEAAVQRHLFTADMPDPDLLIRTSGEKRVSNFLLWQLAYTELVFIDTLWPDFSRRDLEEAIHEFHRRERRYGTVG